MLARRLRFGLRCCVAPAAAFAMGCSLVFSGEAPEPRPPPQIPVDLPRLSGRVLSVDPEASRVILVDAGQRYSIFYDTNTVMRRGSQDISIADLHRGERLVVSMRTEPPGEARLIAVPSASDVPEVPLASTASSPVVPVIPVIPPRGPR